MRLERQGRVQVEQVDQNLRVGELALRPPGIVCTRVSNSTRSQASCTNKTAPPATRTGSIIIRTRSTSSWSAVRGARVKTRSTPSRATSSNTSSLILRASRFQASDPGGKTAVTRLTPSNGYGRLDPVNVANSPTTVSLPTPGGPYKTTSRINFCSYFARNPILPEASAAKGQVATKASGPVVRPLPNIPASVPDTVGDHGIARVLWLPTLARRGVSLVSSLGGRRRASPGSGPGRVIRFTGAAV